MIFQNNPRIAPPGSEGAPDLHWIEHYKGKRAYNSLSADRRRWIWNYKFKVKPGRFYFRDEDCPIKKGARPIVVIEPNVEWQKEVATNKAWGLEKYSEVANAMRDLGCDVFQFRHKNACDRVLAELVCDNELPFRLAIAALSTASLYIGPEGGMHHAAAAVGVPAVVIFGGFIPPSVMGYDFHANMSAGGEACGNIKPCEHCRAAMDSITPEAVIFQALNILNP